MLQTAREKLLQKLQRSGVGILVFSAFISFYMNLFMRIDFRSPVYRQEAMLFSGVSFITVVLMVLAFKPVNIGSEFVCLLGSSILVSTAAITGLDWNAVLQHGWFAVLPDMLLDILILTVVVFPVLIVLYLFIVTVVIAIRARKTPG